MTPAELKAHVSATIKEQMKASGGSIRTTTVIDKLIAECNFSEQDHAEQSMRLIAAREGFRLLLGSLDPIGAPKELR